MNLNKRFSFSILQAFLILTIVALAVSHVAMFRRLQQAREQVRQAEAEIDIVRKEYGYLRGEDPGKIHIVRIQAGERQREVRVRMRIPPGQKLMLNIADTRFSPQGEPVSWKPTQSMSMNNWSQGADVILRWTWEHDDQNVRRFRAWTDSQTLFDYRLEEWEETDFPYSVGGSLGEGEQSFSPDGTIRFTAFWNDETRRGFIFWMEPTQRWAERREAEAHNANAIAE